MTTPFRFVLGLALLGSWISTSWAGPAVNIVIGPEPPPLVRLAADEMADQLQKLFEAEVSITAELADGSGQVILLGNPETNPTIADRIGSFWPTLTDQAIVLKTLGLGNRQPALVVGGGSPVATLWAAYELGHHFGIRYTLTDDLLPPAPEEFQLAGINILSEPTLKARGWEVMDFAPEGFGGWGIDDYRRFFRQLAKLKFNRLHIVAPAIAQAPFVRYEYQDISNTDDALLAGPRIRVDGDTAGRRAFHGNKEYSNPAFATAKTNEERLAAGVELLHGVIDAGHDLGFDVRLVVSPGSHGESFRKVLGPAAQDAEEGIETRWSPTDRIPNELGAIKLQAYLKEYPQVNGIVLSGSDAVLEFFKEHMKDQKASGLFKNETMKFLVAVSGDKIRYLPGWLHEIVTPFHISRRQPSSGVSGIDLSTFDRGGGLSMPRNIRGVSQTNLNPIDAYLPAASHGYMAGVVEVLKGGDWDGFVVQTSVMGDGALAVAGFSRTAYGSTLSAAEILKETLVTATGSAHVAERCVAAMGLVERADLLGPICESDLLGGSTALLRQFQSSGRSHQPNLVLLREKREFYTKATDEFFRAHDGCRPHMRPLLYYRCKRGEFAIHYLNFAEAMIEAGNAKREGKAEVRAEKLEKALESIYNACNSMSEVARDPSDRGLIAALNEYAYRPLKKLIETEAEAAEAE